MASDAKETSREREACVNCVQEYTARFKETGPELLATKELKELMGTPGKVFALVDCRGADEQESIR